MGGIIAAATAGILAGFGVRAGDLFLRLNHIAAPVLGADRVGMTRGFDVLVTPTGLLVHAAWTILAGLALALLLARRRPTVRILAAIGAAVILLLVQRTWAPWIAGSTDDAPVVLAQGVVFALTFAAALAAGMRLAFPPDGAMQGGRA